MDPDLDLGHIRIKKNNHTSGQIIFFCLFFSGSIKCPNALLVLDGNLEYVARA